MSVILYSDKVPLLKHWYKFLEDLNLNVYVTKTKAELFEYFNLDKKSTILIMENNPNDEKNEEFLALLKRTYPLVKVCILSFNPSIKEGSEYLKLGVKGYGNAYMYSLHVKDMTESIIDDNYWYYPEFLEAFSNTKNNQNMLEIGKVSNVKNLVLSRTDEEEHIVLLDEKIYKNEIFTTPYKDSFVELELANQRLISIGGNNCIYLDKSVFIEDDLSEFCVFSKEKSLEILSYLGESEELVGGNFLPKNIKDKEEKKEAEKEEKEERKEGEILAKYSGRFEEYKIKPSKQMHDFLIIKDTKKNRDGSDLINKQIAKFIFADVEKTYDELTQNMQ